MCQEGSLARMHLSFRWSFDVPCGAAETPSSQPLHPGGPVCDMLGAGFWCWKGSHGHLQGQPCPTSFLLPPLASSARSAGSQAVKYSPQCGDPAGH